jgi:hypothetical protein
VTAGDQDWGRDRDRAGDRERREAADLIRAVSLLAAAVARIGTGVTPGQLMSEAAQYVTWVTRPPARMMFTVTTEGDQMPLTVDSANAVAILSFTDDHGDAVAPPDGAVATAASSDTGVLSVGAGAPGTDANGVANIQFPLSEVAAGSADLSVTTADASGNPLLGPDGVTPIPVPSPVTVTVTPGAPAAEVFTVPGA